MLVTDLHHFLDLPPETPGPARRLAEQLSDIVRAATAGDTGTAWENSPYDLRGRRLVIAGAVNEIIIGDQIAAALRELQLLDPDCERLVFAICAHHDDAVLTATDDDLDELIGSVAAETSHESNRRRRQRFDAAFDALTAAQTPGHWRSDGPAEVGCRTTPHHRRAARPFACGLRAGMAGNA